MVHSDFHYAKAMLFSALKLWYYISLSLYHFQRLPFLLIKLNRMLKISRACFWACLTLLLWSHIHSHTHLLGFSNLAISCGCPALSIWVFVVIYASHLSHVSNPWVIFSLRLTFAACLTLPAGGQAPLPPSLSTSSGLHCDASLHSSGWVALTLLLWFHKAWWLFFLAPSIQRPLTCLACVHTATGTWCSSLSVFFQHSCHAALSDTSSQTPCSSTLHPDDFHLFSTPKVSEEGDGSPEGTSGRVLLGTAGSWGVSVGPGCDLATGGTTWVFPVWSAPRHLPVIKQC